MTCRPSGRIDLPYRSFLLIFLIDHPVRVVAGVIEAGAGKRKRGNDMEDLEAELDATAAAGVPAGGGTNISGFVSAGVVQQSAPQDGPEGLSAGAAAPSEGAIRGLPCARACQHSLVWPILAQISITQGAVLLVLQQPLLQSSGGANRGVLHADAI